MCFHHLFSLYPIIGNLLLTYEETKSQRYEETNHLMILGPMKIHKLRARGVKFSYQTILLVQNKWTFIHMLIVHVFETNSTIWYENSTALQSVWKQTPLLFISTAV